MTVLINIFKLIIINVIILFCNTESGFLDAEVNKHIEKKNEQDLEAFRNLITIDHHYHKTCENPQNVESDYFINDNYLTTDPLTDLDIPSLSNLDALFTEIF